MADLLDLDDETLVAKYCENGCQEAVEELMDRYLDRLQPLLLQLGVPRTDVPDLTQDILVKAFRGLPGFKRRAKFSTWLMSIAVRSARDYFRKQQSRKVSLSHILDDIAAPAASHRNPSMDQETWNKVNEAVSNLSEPQRAAVVLTCLQDLSPSEAAEVCGCSRNTLYFRLHAARKKLKIALKDILE